MSANPYQQRYEQKRLVESLKVGDRIAESTNGRTYQIVQVTKVTAYLVQLSSGSTYRRDFGFRTGKLFGQLRLLSHK